MSNPAFQRRHYEAIAAAIHRSRMASNITGSAPVKAAKAAALQLVALDLTATFAQDNPQFDRARFLKACGVDAS